MNNPPYVFVDEQSLIVQKVAVKLGIDIGFHYGYIKELNETLVQYSKSPATYNKKFPLIWLVQPFTISIGEELGNYGSIRDLRIFIIQQSEKNYKAAERMTKVFKPVLYPIYHELIAQMKVHSTIFFQGKHKMTDRYYWGDSQQTVLNDVVDCMELSQIELKVKNKRC